MFIFDRHHLEHAGFICAKAQSCVVVGGSRSNGNRNVPFFPILILMLFHASDGVLLKLFIIHFFSRVMPTLDYPALQLHLVFHSPQGSLIGEGLHLIVC